MNHIGIDIIENERVRRVLSEPLMRKILSQEEYEKCQDYPEEKKVRFVAGRFACKEAIIKCLSDFELPELSDLNITNNEKGKPEIIYKDYKISVSISHEKNYSTAIAIMEK